jgi:hypothetical protein
MYITIVPVYFGFSHSISVIWPTAYCFTPSCIGTLAHMSNPLQKNYHISVVIFHVIYPTRYQPADFDAIVHAWHKEGCLHLLRQSVPTYSSMPLVKRIKSRSARELFLRVPTVNKQREEARLGHWATLSARRGGMGVQRSFTHMVGNQGWKSLHHAA